MTKFFFEFKKSYFGLLLAHFCNFGGRKHFCKKSVCHAQLDIDKDTDIDIDNLILISTMSKYRET